MTPAEGIQPPTNHGWWAYVALGAGVVCIAWSAIFVLLADVPGPASAFYRVFFAGLVVVPWWLRRRQPLPESAALRLTLAAGLFFALDLALWNTAILLSSASTATLLANNAPLWVGLGTVVVFRERLPALFWIGLGVGLAGTAVVIGLVGFGSAAVGLGDALALAASVLYAAYLLTTQQVRARLDTLTFMAVSACASAAVLLAICLAGDVPLAGYRAASWAALAGLGLVSQLGGWLAINYALGHIRASVASVTLLGQTVLTAFFAMLVLGEQLTPDDAVGGILVLAGIVLVHRGGRPAGRGRRDASPAGGDGDLAPL